MKKTISLFGSALVLLTVLYTVTSFADDSKNPESDLKQTCNSSYRSTRGKRECTLFCRQNREFKNKKYDRDQRKELIAACELGQIIYLKSSSNLKPSEDSKELVEPLKTVCTSFYALRPESQRACKIGVTAEDLRKNPKKKGPGTSSDPERETGR